MVPTDSAQHRHVRRAAVEGARAGAHVLVVWRQLERERPARGVALGPPDDAAGGRSGRVEGERAALELFEGLAPLSELEHDQQAVLVRAHHARLARAHRARGGQDARRRDDHHRQMVLRPHRRVHLHAEGEGGLGRAAGRLVDGVLHVERVDVGIPPRPLPRSTGGAARRVQSMPAQPRGCKGQEGLEQRVGEREAVLREELLHDLEAAFATEELRPEWAEVQVATAREPEKR
eukprot:scaffold11820_cov33-Phaeocystis_antarctica.AAC.1